MYVQSPMEHELFWNVDVLWVADCALCSEVALSCIFIQTDISDANKSLFQFQIHASIPFAPVVICLIYHLVYRAMKKRALENGSTIIMQLGPVSYCINLGYLNNDF